MSDETGEGDAESATDRDDASATDRDDEPRTDRRIRVVALGVVRREGNAAAEEGDGGDEDDAADEGDDRDELLVERERDPGTGEYFYRPLGGGVEFGEHSEDALRREFREELGVELADVSYLETYEDVFSHEGRTHHEIWRLYEASVVEDWPYEKDSFTAYEPDLDQDIECVWKPVAELGPEDGDADTFYPARLLDGW